MEALLSVLIGLGLAAASGFRLFVPPLVLSLAIRSGHFEPGPGLEWLGSDAALVTFAVATALEIAAYYIPWVDNLLDTVATPVAVIAGIVMAAAATAELSPWLRWSLSALGGGGAAAIFQAATAGSRQISSVTTLGFANPLLSTLEALLSMVLSVLAVLAPLAGGVVLLLLVYFVATRVLVRRRPRPAGSAG
jgi:hypothetical protein